MIASVISYTLSKPDDGRYMPKHVVFICYKYHHLAIFIVVFSTEIYPTYNLRGVSAVTKIKTGEEI